MMSCASEGQTDPAPNIVLVGLNYPMPNNVLRIHYVNDQDESPIDTSVNFVVLGTSLKLGT